jgi:hypothetical protein
MTKAKPKAPPRPLWAGQIVPIDELEAFKARWGLVTVGGTWRDTDPRPVLEMVEVS